MLCLRQSHITHRSERTGRTTPPPNPYDSSSSGLHTAAQHRCPCNSNSSCSFFVADRKHNTSASPALRTPGLSLPQFQPASSAPVVRVFKSTTPIQHFLVYACSCRTERKREGGIPSVSSSYLQGLAHSPVPKINLRGLLHPFPYDRVRSGRFVWGGISTQRPALRNGSLSIKPTSLSTGRITHRQQQRKPWKPTSL